MHKKHPKEEKHEEKKESKMKHTPVPTAHKKKKK